MSTVRLLADNVSAKTAVPPGVIAVLIELLMSLALRRCPDAQPLALSDAMRWEAKYRPRLLARLAARRAERAGIPADKVDEVCWGLVAECRRAKEKVVAQLCEELSVSKEKTDGEGDDHD